MSAFIVSRLHIHQLVTALDTYVSPTEEPTALGALLWQENITSISSYYQNELLSDLPGPCDETYVYEYVTPQRPLSAVEVYKVACCYRYQSCEHPAWETSDACHAIEALCAAIEQHLGKTADQIRALPAWNKADWEIYDDTPRLPDPPPDARPVRKIDLVETAKLVRKALKAAYPTVKFSVRCDRYSMGCSIDVFWTDGPTQSQVEPLLKQFDRKSFDGMDDSTHYHTQEYQGERVSFGADYVHGSRSLSLAFLTQIAEKVCKQYQVPVPEVTANGSHPYIASTPASLLQIPGAGRFGEGECLRDLIHHTAYSTSALPKPRIRLMPILRAV